MKQEIWILNGGTPATVSSSLNAIKQCLLSIFDASVIIKEKKGSSLQQATLEFLLSTVALIIIPGGAGQAIYRQLGPLGNQKIKAYVHAGGNYLGICAGAYYGASETQFEVGRGEPYEIASDTDAALGFYPGIAHGVAYREGEFIYHSESGARIANICVNQDLISFDKFNKEKNIPIYFNGGCYFSDATRYETVEILARYADIDDAPSAIVKCQYGNGTAILSGVHFEHNAISIDSQHASKCELINKSLNTNKKNR
jgi:biotin--protein ligase